MKKEYTTPEINQQSTYTEPIADDNGIALSDNEDYFPGNW